jgi:hypothetical protein
MGQVLRLVTCILVEGFPWLLSLPPDRRRDSEYLELGHIPSSSPFIDYPSISRYTESRHTNHKTETRYG